MTMHTPTPEQEAILALARDTTDNILVSALAGAAKTTTLELIAKELAPKSMLCLAFNKKIAVEMQERLPPNCKAMTLNALGHRTWSEAIGRKLKIDAGKGYEIMSGLIEQLDKAEQRAAYDRMGELMRIVAFGKACGYIPTDTNERAKRLMDDDEFFNHIDQELAPWEQELVRAATLVSLKQAFEGVCDYDDQILMPTIFHGAFPRFPIVLVDEAQDLSALNHAMLRKMTKASRVIAVGDQCQAIYGFRGAHEDSMEQLKTTFNMTEMVLSISFRCPQAIVRHAHWRAPHMRWPEWAKEGSVTSWNEWGAAALPASAAVLCRNNAPLFALAIKLLKNGRTCELGGRDIVKSLTAVMRKFGGHDLRTPELLDRIDNWVEEQKAKNKKRSWPGIEDRAECMRIFANQAEDLGGALAYAQHMAQMNSPLKLLTGHKAKGLEFDHVFILNADLMSKEGQDPNLRYVMITRAKETLTYVELEHFQDAVCAVA